MGIFDGGLFSGGGMFGGGGGGSQTVISNQEPWSELKPYLLSGFNRQAQIAESNVPSYFPGSTVTPFANESKQALQAQANRARMGSPLTQSAQRETLDTIGGKYLSPDSNPYLQQTFDSLTNRIGRNVDSRFVDANRYGSEAHKRNLAESYGDVGTQLYGQNYQTERGRQQAAAFGAPGMAQSDYGDIQALGNVGMQREQKADQYLQDQMNRFNFQQQLPQQKLNQYMNTLRGIGGGTNTTSQPVYSSPMIAGMGGAATGAGIASLMNPQNPSMWGPMLGAAAGYFGAG
jgi:hypothetical protein